MIASMALDLIKKALVDDLPYYLSMSHIISLTQHFIEYDIDILRLRIISQFTLKSNSISLASRDYKSTSKREILGVAKTVSNLRAHRSYENEHELIIKLGKVSFFSHGLRPM